MQVECIRGNVLGVLNLADVTMQKGLHMTNFATGCIFHYDDKFTIESGKVWLPYFLVVCCSLQLLPDVLSLQKLYTTPVWHEIVVFSVCHHVNESGVTRDMLCAVLCRASRKRTSPTSLAHTTPTARQSARTFWHPSKTSSRYAYACPSWLTLPTSATSSPRSSSTLPLSPHLQDEELCC